MEFTNDVIHPESLPRYEAVPLTPIDRRYRKIILWNWLFATIILAGAVVLFFIVGDWYAYRWIAVVIAIPVVIAWGILHLKAFERRSYAVRSHDLIYRHGILSVSTTVIPFNRIQHVSVKEGVLSRLYGLASIQIFTAGGAAADLQLRGLALETAGQLKEIILEKIRG